MRRLNIRGQSTLEYVIIWTAIVVGILVAANTFFSKDSDDAAVRKTIKEASGKIDTEVENLMSSIGDTGN